MDFLKKSGWTPARLLKVALLFVGAVIAISLVFRLFGALSGTLSGSLLRGARNLSVTTQEMMSPSFMYDTGGTDGAMKEARLSLDNIGLPISPPRPGGVVGGDAEEFEVSEYHASIETRDKEKLCAKVAELKTLEYVVFENANEYDRGCSYTFKVLHDRVPEILAVVESFAPKELSENTYSIKRELDDFTSETEILEKKLTSIDETLEQAIDAYDDIARIATRTNDAIALAKIFDSKINIIERLTLERIAVAGQLERLSRAKAEQLDRLDYTYFYVSVYENKFVDGKNIKESWKAAVQEFVRDLNGILQDVTVNLLAFLFFLAQYVLYLGIILTAAKYLWKAAKYIWKR